LERYFNFYHIRVEDKGIVSEKGEDSFIDMKGGIYIGLVATALNRLHGE